MAWSYDPNLPTKKDEVRLIIGDTDIDDQLLQDEEIEYFLEQSQDSVIQASIKAVMAIIAKLSRKVDKSVGEAKLSLSQQIEHYQKLLDNLKSNMIVTPEFETPPDAFFTRDEPYNEYNGGDSE